MFAAAIGVSAGCYQLSSTACPNQVTYDGMRCNSEVSGQYYPSIWDITTNPHESGRDSYTWDNTRHCLYDCPDGSEHRFYTGTYPAGNECTGGEDGSGSDSGTWTKRMSVVKINSPRHSFITQVSFATY